VKKKCFVNTTPDILKTRWGKSKGGFNQIIRHMAPLIPGLSSRVLLYWLYFLDNKTGYLRSTKMLTEKASIGFWQQK